MLRDSLWSQHPIFLASVSSACWTEGRGVPRPNVSPRCLGRGGGGRGGPLSCQLCAAGGELGATGGLRLQKSQPPARKAGCWTVSPPGPLPLDVTLWPPRCWTGSRPADASGHGAGASRARPGGSRGWCSPHMGALSSLICLFCCSCSRAEAAFCHSHGRDSQYPRQPPPQAQTYGATSRTSS